MTKLRRHWDNVRITCRNRDALSRNGSKMKSEKTIIFDLSEVIIRRINIGPSNFSIRDQIDIDRIYKFTALVLEHCQQAK